MFNIPTQRLAKVTVTETTSAVTLSVNPIVIAALSFTPRHLVLRWNAQGSGSGDAARLQLNGDTGNNYNYQRLSGATTTLSAARNSALANIFLGEATNATNEFSGGFVLLPDALSTRSHKSVTQISGSMGDRLDIVAGRWANTAAVTSVTWVFDTGALTGSTFELCVVDESFNIDQDGDGEQILGSNGTFSVGSIGAADGDLVCIGNFRSTRSGLSDNVDFWLNGDTTATNYTHQYIRGIGTSPASAAGNDNDVGVTVATSATTSAFSPYLSQVTNFSRGSNDRVVTTFSGAFYDSSNSQVKLNSCRWNNTAAVTSVQPKGTVADDWLTGSMLSTYAVPKNLIERQELGADTTTVTFSDIPQTYDHLELGVYARTTRAATRGSVFIAINGDTTDTNYTLERVVGDLTSAASLTAQNRTFGVVPANHSTTGANIYGTVNTTIYNYTKTDRDSHFISVSGHPTLRVDLRSFQWDNTAAVTSLVLTADSGNYMAGSVFTLRGINSTVAAATSDVAALNGIAPADIEAVN